MLYLIEEWVREGCPATDEGRMTWAMSIMECVGAQSFRRVFKDRKAVDARRPPVSGSSNFYCPRQIYYSLAGCEKEEPAPRALNTFWLGDMVEALAVSQMILAGLPVLWPKYGQYQYECKLDLEGDEIKGHVDVVLEVEGAEYPVEVKSMSEYGWKKSAKDGVDNTFGYIDQLQFYLHAMNAPKGAFVGVNKSTGHMFWEEVQRDPDAIERIRESYVLARDSTLGGPPPRPEWATTKDIAGCEQIESVRCSYCSYRPICWPGYEMKVVSGRPVYRKEK